MSVPPEIVPILILYPQAPVFLFHSSVVVTGTWVDLFKGELNDTHAKGSEFTVKVISLRTNKRF